MEECSRYLNREIEDRPSREVQALEHEISSDKDLIAVLAKKVLNFPSQEA